MDSFNIIPILYSVVKKKIKKFAIGIEKTKKYFIII